MTANASQATCTLSTYIAGERPRQITFSLVRDMGATLAKIQNAFTGMQVSFNESQWFDPINVEHQLKVYKGPQKQQITRLITNSLIILNSKLPKSLIHGDLHIHNIFAHNNRVGAVFDLETAAYTLRILDIARTYLTLVKGTSFESHETYVRLANHHALLATYQPNFA